MGYDYQQLLDEFLDYSRDVIYEFTQYTKHHYGREQAEKAGIDKLAGVLYTRTRQLYETGRKHSRAVQAYYIFPQLSPEAKRLLAAVDLFIALLDEAYDEDQPRDERMITLGIMMSTTPYLYKASSKNPQIADALARYMTMPAYVALTQRMKNMSLIDWYYWRASDMDFFMEAPARLLGHNEDTVKNLIEAGRWMRAITLVWKDVKDVEHDKATGAENPFKDASINPREIIDELLARLKGIEARLESEIASRIMDIAYKYTIYG